MHIPIFGNGDIDSPQKALAYKNKYGVDGVMIGRASIGYPWVFNEIKHFVKTGELLSPPTLAERIAVTKKHLDFSIRWKGPKLGVFEMRRHYTNYFKGIADVKTFRAKLVEAPTGEEVFEILDDMLHTLHPAESLT
jgi:tRNA-dihydrouridine synthase B